MEYQALSAAEERQVFQRVQLGMSLTAAGAFSLLVFSALRSKWMSTKPPAEKLQAIATPRSDYTKDLHTRYFSVGTSLANHVEFDGRRGCTFQNLASMLYLCEKVDLQRTPSAEQVEEWLSCPDELSQIFKVKIERMISDLRKIAQDVALNEGFTAFTARVSPAEFVFIGT